MTKEIFLYRIWNWWPVEHDQTRVNWRSFRKGLKSECVRGCSGACWRGRSSLSACTCATGERCVQGMQTNEMEAFRLQRKRGKHACSHHARMGLSFLSNGITLVGAFYLGMVFKPSFKCFENEKVNFIQAILKLETLLYQNVYIISFNFIFVEPFWLIQKQKVVQQFKKHSNLIISF